MVPTKEGVRLFKSDLRDLITLIHTLNKEINAVDSASTKRRRDMAVMRKRARAVGELAPWVECLSDHESSDEENEAPNLLTNAPKRHPSLKRSHEQAFPLDKEDDATISKFMKMTE